MHNNSDLESLHIKWTNATAQLPWGVQRAFTDVLYLASQEKTTLVYGADYYDKGNCLVNQAQNMLFTASNYQLPASAFNEIVCLFDLINRVLHDRNVNTTHKVVSPLAADILLDWFAPLKEEPIENQVNEATKNEAFAEQIPYVEPSDDELMKDMLAMFESEAPVEPEGGVIKFKPGEVTLDPESGEFERNEDYQSRSS